jgi:uncharacterized protein with HEPN domain
MYKRPSELLIADILESIEKIESYTLNISFENFKKRIAKRLMLLLET